MGSQVTAITIHTEADNQDYEVFGERADEKTLYLQNQIIDPVQQKIRKLFSEIQREEALIQGCESRIGNLNGRVEELTGLMSKLEKNQKLTTQQKVTSISLYGLGALLCTAAISAIVAAVVLMPAIFYTLPAGNGIPGAMAFLAIGALLIGIYKLSKEVSYFCGDLKQRQEQMKGEKAAIKQKQTQIDQLKNYTTLGLARLQRELAIEKAVLNELRLTQFED